MTAALFAAALLVGPAVARAGQTTVLKDKTGYLTLEAPGRWRSVPSGGAAFRATGFLGGVKRVEIQARLHSDITDATELSKGWHKKRSNAGDEVAITAHGTDGLRWIAHSAKRNTVDYVRALAGADRGAVVWVRANGAPGTIDGEAFALLDKVRLAKPKPKAEEKPPEDEKKPEKPTFEDTERIVKLVLPEGFTLNKDVKPTSRRVISVKGTVGTDDDAYLDVYAFPEFDRLDALGWWWVNREQRGWGGRPLEFKGVPPTFKILPEDETWTRHVRLLETPAGLYGIKLDVESKADTAADELLGDLVHRKGFSVLRKRPEKPVPPEGTTPHEGATHTVFVPAGTTPDAFGKEGARAAELVDSISDLKPRDGRRGVVRVYATQDALDTAVRVLGHAPGEAAYWVPARRQVYTHAKALSETASVARLRFELAREAFQRRVGFRPPFWIEYGTAFLASATAYNKGRADQAHPDLLVAARDAIATSIIFEHVRFWLSEESATNVERSAIAWGTLLILTEGSGPARKWDAALKDYVKRLLETARPDLANKAFDLSKDAAFVEEWKKAIRKL